MPQLKNLLEYVWLLIAHAEASWKTCTSVEIGGTPATGSYEDAGRFAPHKQGNYIPVGTLNEFVGGFLSMKIHDSFGELACHVSYKL
jgi:hypothetical protein